MDKPSWRDTLLGILVGGLLWLPFSLTGLLAGAIPAVVIVGVGFALALPILSHINRSFPEATTKRVLSKLALLACVLVLAVLMKLVIAGGLTHVRFGMLAGTPTHDTPAIRVSLVIFVGNILVVR